VVIVTDHDGVDYQAIMDAASLVVDTRNAAARTRTSRARVVSLSATSTAGATQPAAPTRERPVLAAR
jgi:UDP-N-acetyl-D-mannosaminuronate dehydrogenase